MKLNENNLDKIFREKLEGQSIPPPPGGWEVIQGGLKKIKRGKRVFLYRAVAVAAVVIFAFIGGWLLNNNRQEIIPQVVQEQSEEASLNETTKETTPKLIQEELIDAPNISIAKTITNEEETTISDKIIQPDESSFILTENSEAINTRSKETGLKLLAGFKAFIGNSIKNENLRQKKESTIIPTDVLTEEDRKLIAQNINDYINNATPSGSWELGLRFSPGYSSQYSNHSEEYKRNMTWSNTDGSVDLNGGISVEYKTGKRWSVESGIYYSKNSQNSGNSIKSYNEVLYQANTDAIDFFNTPVELKQGAMTMNSTAGVIEFSNTPENSEVYGGLDALHSFSNVLLTPGEFSQVFNFIEIPLYLKYLLIDGNLDIEVLGGVSANLLVGNNVYMTYEGVKQNIGETADISSLNYSGTLGIGLDYELGKNFSVSFEPRVNYFFSSINKNDAVDYRPYRFGIYSGINYRF